MLFQFQNKLFCRTPSGIDHNGNDIRIDRPTADLEYLALRDGLANHLRVGVILDKSFAIVFNREQGTGSDHA